MFEYISLTYKENKRIQANTVLLMWNGFHTPNGDVLATIKGGDLLLFPL